MKQITFAPRNHLLTNTNTWTPDSQWLVFDVRPSGASFTGETIERVNIHTGEVEVIYRASQGARVGVPALDPALPAAEPGTTGRSPTHPASTGTARS